MISLATLLRSGTPLTRATTLQLRTVTPHANNRHGSNPVSGGQCHIIHLTILKRLSWSSLAYLFTKVA